MSAENKPAAGTTAREDFTGHELVTTGETAISAAAAQATALVQARFLMAARFPRDMDQARARLMLDCKRPAFAERATYKLPMMKKPAPSIRFAEAAMRALRNLDVQTAVTFDDAERRMIRVTATDLESNNTVHREVMLMKTVERRELREGQVALKTRTNSEGVAVHTVEASEADLGAKQGALESKALRTLVLRLVPADIVDDALAQCRATVANKAAKDPEAQRKAIADAFMELGVTPAKLAEYLGHDLGSCSPVEIADLRDLFSAIDEGAGTFSEALASKHARAAADAPEAKIAEGTSAAAPPPRAKTADELRAEARAKQTPGAKP